MGPYFFFDKGCRPHFLTNCVLSCTHQRTKVSWHSVNANLKYGRKTWIKVPKALMDIVYGRMFGAQILVVHVYVIGINAICHTEGSTFQLWLNKGIKIVPFVSKRRFKFENDNQDQKQVLLRAFILFTDVTKLYCSCIFLPSMVLFTYTIQYEIDKWETLWQLFLFLRKYEKDFH